MQQFANPLAPGGFFGLEQVGNSTFTTITEPSTYIAALGLLRSGGTRRARAAAAEEVELLRAFHDTRTATRGCFV